jgi:hypothetical protein
MRFAIEQRLRMIDFLLAHYGWVNRATIGELYGIIKIQVTSDFNAYKELAPGNMAYNLSTKRYERQPEFQRLYE